MMKESKIRAIIPFVIVFASTFFLADADILHNFGTRLEMLRGNSRLVYLLFTSDAGQSIEWFCCSLIFFIAWHKNKAKGFWYVDILWQLSGIFFCWSILSVISLISNFYSYLWIQGMFRLFVFIFGFYFLNTLYAARNLIFYPESRDESIRKAQKFDELIKLIKDEK